MLSYLATLTRNQVRFAGTRTTVPMLAQPTSTQREAFDLIGMPIPLALIQPEQPPGAAPKPQFRAQIPTQLDATSA